MVSKIKKKSHDKYDINYNDKLCGTDMHIHV